MEHGDTPSDQAPARFYFLARWLHVPQTILVRLLRRFFAHDPRWVLLTTRGRKTGLEREVILPCRRTADAIIVVSTYGRRANWFRNLERDPHVRVTCAGWTMAAQAEIVDDLETKRALVSNHPYVGAFPLVLIPFILHPLLYPIAVPAMRAFVRHRPVVVLHRAEPR